MTFTTATFALFLAVVFGLHWSLRTRLARNTVLLVASYAFYGWWDWRFSGLMLAASLIDFVAGLAIAGTEVVARRRLWLTLSLGANLAMLGFFKYFDFFAESLRELLMAFGLHASPVVLQVVLPAGISFYTFQTMSYTIDVYRRELPASRNLVDYMAFVSFFPHLVAGPIQRASWLLPQISSDRTFDLAEASDGCREILWGVFKKLVLADPLSLVVDPAYAAVTASSGSTLALATVSFALQIYFDFSAYSHVATGVARLFGIRLTRNFAYPYFSQSMGEFWRRWHISLSSWFRDYLFIPLGGARTGPVRRARNVLVTFVASGLWHGASWTYVAWGALNGLAVVPVTLGLAAPGLKASDVPGGEALLPSPRVVARMLATFIFTCACWVFFRAASLGDAVTVFRRMGTDLVRADGWARFAMESLSDGARSRTFALVLAAMALEWLTRRGRHPFDAPSFMLLPRWQRWSAYTVIAWLVLLFGTRSHGSFIYFQF